MEREAGGEAVVVGRRREGGGPVEVQGGDEPAQSERCQTRAGGEVAERGWGARVRRRCFNL